MRRKISILLIFAFFLILFLNFIIVSGEEWIKTGELSSAMYVRSLLQANDGTLYAGVTYSLNGYSKGGVFKSTDNGTTWTNTGELVNAIYGGFLLEASDGTLYSGNTLLVGGYYKAGVFKSTNKGDTWIFTGILQDTSFFVSILEASDGTLYAGTGYHGDVFKSTNKGDTWINTGNLTIMNGRVHYASDLLEANDGTLYAITSGDEYIFKSTNKGDTWENIGVFEGGLANPILLQANDGTLYVGTGPNGEIFKSTDNGITWTNTGNLSSVTYVYSLIQANDGTLYVGTGPNGDVFKMQITEPVITPSYCGDEICNNSENCSTCANDCGICLVNNIELNSTLTVLNPNEKIKSWNEIIPEKTVFMDGFNETSSINEIAVKVNFKDENVTINVTEYDEKPLELKRKNGKIYKYFSVKTLNLENINNARIKIQVNKSWITENNLDKNGISLFRLHEGETSWEEIETTYIGEYNGFYYYDAILSGFSYFAIGEKDTELSKKDDNKTIKKEGVSSKEDNKRSLVFFWILIFVITLIIVVLSVFIFLKIRNKNIPEKRF